MIIDFASRPPLAEFMINTPHMSNYRRVYAKSESLVSKASGPEALADYLALYDRLNARHVVLKARDAQTTMGFKVPNEAIADFCDKFGPRFIGFAAVDPHRGADALDELNHAIRDLGLRGLNVQGFEHRLAINDPKLMALYERCAELDIPVNIHCGMNFSLSSKAIYGHPLALDDVLTAFPTLRVCASPPGWPWISELIAMAWRHPNLWIGLSAVRPKLAGIPGSGYEPLLRYGAGLLKQRVLFGSGYPMIPVDRSIAEIEELGLTDDVRRAWLYDNAAAYLRLH
ncbi:Predicted metal-dependent hydrolase of the TIM-barrel fold [Achromobacter denitrificans]|jgi:predicted TIM-barrel fold metal-dependent hydrolase|uniref:Amidohydrolase n=1 Tax=Achromobacter denitrificans TaxID=32002 RepID=A0A6N0JH19_ACHDE|nr:MULTISPECIES: amidohydrolase family protein [Achromobacter]ASC66675.1 amidohydrolase [Achromobacter denitrificans]MDF3862650.1 amidohydrolase family protein [Achromobacter denitrificans]MPT39386.1 amidohydrolase [Achromobacter sp.]OLU06765.1 amidohydrolase [Achromobacter denitrificans]QKH42240.1 amidohydrolase [Achromobacter denitrificans]